MSDNRRIPHSIDAFNTYIGIVLGYLTTNATRLGITTENITLLTNLITNSTTGWNRWFTLHASPATRTAAVNAYLHDSENTITHTLQDIYADIPRSAMTNDDYLTLNIAPPVTHRAARAAITNIPFAKVFSVGGAKVNFIVRTDSHANRAAMDPLADAIEVKGKLIGAEDPNPLDPTACNLDFNSKQALFSQTFEAANAGKKFACFLRFVNLTDESKDGGWSGCISCIIGL